jgi:hypothetical protein
MKESFHHFFMNNYGKPRNEWRFSDQERPEPTPGRPKPIPRQVSASAAAPSRAEHAAYLRKEMAKIKEEKQAPDKLADQIIEAGKKARGEISNASDPPGLAGQILAAGRKRRGEDR